MIKFWGMEIIFFIKKYYGALIGGLVGIFLTALHFLSLFKIIEIIPYLSSISEFLFKPVEVVSGFFTLIIAVVLLILTGPFVYIMEHPISIAFVRLTSAVCFYGTVGFLAHYVLYRFLQPKQPLTNRRD